MSHQGLMGRETRIPATPVDLHSMVAARKSPGILILNEFGDVLHLNDMAWEALSLLREMERDVMLVLVDEPETELLDGDAGSLKGVVSMGVRHYYAAHD